MHKQSLEYLLRFQSEKTIPNLPVDIMKKVKNIRPHPSPDSLNDLLSTSQWEEIKKKLLHRSGTEGKWILEYITDVRAILSQIAAYCEKKSCSYELNVICYHYRLHLIIKTIRDILPLITLN